MERAGVDVLFGEKQAKQNVSEGTHTPMLSRMSGRDTCPAPRAAVSEIYRVATAHGGWRRLVVLNLLRLEFVYDLEHGVVDRVEAALLVGVPLIARTTEKFEEIDADVVILLPSAAAQDLLSMVIVPGPLRWVRESAVRLRDLLEALGCLLQIVGILVRMPLLAGARRTPLSCFLRLQPLPDRAQRRQQECGAANARKDRPGVRLCGTPP